MGILVKQVTLRGDKGQVELDGMFDTGATYSVIRKDIAEQIATVIPLDEPIALRTAEQGRQLTVTHRVVLTIWLNGYRLSDEFLVLEELSRPVLIGAATCKNGGYGWTWQTRKSLLTRQRQNYGCFRKEVRRYWFGCDLCALAPEITRATELSLRMQRHRETASSLRFWGTTTQRENLRN